jgi:dienelactone hydrolase
VQETPAAASPVPRSRDDAPVREQEQTPVRRLFEERVFGFTPPDGVRLDGLLTVPRGGQRIPYPAVLFVHDTGPLDRDATVGPNRPFRDLARGLAVFGVASFRYDKRTLAAPRTIAAADATVEEEVIGDALAALEALRSQSGIDGRAIAILGHGLGGSLAATIARRDGGVSGIVVLAGSSRPLDELIRDTITRLGTEGAESLLSQLDSLAAGTLPDERAILGIRAGYLRDYRSRDITAEFLAFDGPVLFLQGGKDHLTPARELDHWKERMASGAKANVTFRLDPRLGHLFIPIAGEGSPESLLVPGTVDAGVTAEIAGFVKELR